MVTAYMQQTTRRNILRSLHFRAFEGWGRFRLQATGALIGKGVKAVGAAIITLHPDSEIRVGNQVTLISKSFATALGVHHPIILRTLAAGARIEIGRGTGISGGSICAARLVTIGEETRLGANVTITDSDFHSLQPANRSGHSHASIGIAEVHIGSRVLIGTNSIVLKGVTIGDNCVIGAGSVVTKNIPANSIAAGNPCRVLRELTAEELSAQHDA
jgi:acetyltransferase-like isoleucine patch superfamily enzyme